MQVVRFNEAPTYEPQKNWTRHSLCDQKDISVEYYVKPPHHPSPIHEHPNAQVLIVLKGKLTVKVNEEEETLGEGDAVYIPAGETHVVTNPLDEESIGLDIFVPGRAFDFWLTRGLADSGKR